MKIWIKAESSSVLSVVTGDHSQVCGTREKKTQHSTCEDRIWKCKGSSKNWLGIQSGVKAYPALAGTPPHSMPFRSHTPYAKTNLQGWLWDNWARYSTAITERHYYGKPHITNITSTAGFSPNHMECPCLCCIKTNVCRYKVGISQ